MGPFVALAGAAQEPATKWESLKMLTPGTELRVGLDWLPQADSGRRS